MRFELTPQGIVLFRSYIFSWWKTHVRDLPWRKTKDPYRVLVSEIMLQQTQVSRVVDTYCAFIKQYPTVFDLARASTADILRLWKGMGYNRRAVYLHRLAIEIVTTYKNKFPISEQQLTKLPGVGKYTARALLVFAYKKDVAMVDTNIRKIITHFFYSGKLQREKIIQHAADMLVPKGKSWEWHQALMDYGTLELGNMVEKKQRNKRAGAPFKDTDRYFRGRMMDILRERTILETELIQTMALTYDKSEAFAKKILDSLVADGLAAKSNGSVKLPE